MRVFYLILDNKILKNNTNIIIYNKRFGLNNIKNIIFLFQNFSISLLIISFIHLLY